MQPERMVFSATAQIDGNTLSGVAHVFGQRTLIGNKYVEFAPTAFNDALAHSDARAFVNHNTDLLLGRQSAGTLRLVADSYGLNYSIDLPDTSYAKDLKVLVERGDLSELSFGIFPGKVKTSKATDGRQVITHTSVSELFDVSPVSLPAFGGTSMQLHSGSHSTDDTPTQSIKARLRVNRR